MLLRRVWTGAPLAAPFAMQMTPPSFGPQGGRLLVTNWGNGRGNWFDLSTESTTTQPLLLGGAPFAELGIRGTTFGGPSVQEQST